MFLKCYIGNEQHNREHHFTGIGKIKDELDACVRHLIDHIEEPIDDDGLLHLGAAWRTLGALENF